MKYNEVVRVRMEKDLKTEIKKISNGNMSEFFRGLAIDYIETIKTKNKTRRVTKQVKKRTLQQYGY